MPNILFERTLLNTLVKVFLVIQNSWPMLVLNENLAFVTPRVHPSFVAMLAYRQAALAALTGNRGIWLHLQGAERSFAQTALPA